MSAIQGRPVEILLVEDSPGDIRLTIEALKDSKILNTLHVAKNGVEAMAYLRQEGGYEHSSRPDLVMLDLNLPMKNGMEVLAEIKEDPTLQRIPVVILSMSGAEKDILKSYKLHANCYIQKPVDLMQFMEVVKSIEDFWFTIVKLPSSEG